MDGPWESRMAEADTEQETGHQTHALTGHKDVWPAFTMIPLTKGAFGLPQIDKVHSLSIYKQ